MIEEAGAHLRTMDDSLIKQQHMSERLLNDLEEKLTAKQEVQSNRVQWHHALSLPCPDVHALLSSIVEFDIFVLFCVRKKLTSWSLRVKRWEKRLKERCKL